MHGAVKHVRMPAVAGVFYPADAAVLRHDIATFLREADSAGPYPKAMIVPHAGYSVFRTGGRQWLLSIRADPAHHRACRVVGTVAPRALLRPGSERR